MAEMQKGVRAPEYMGPEFPYPEGKLCPHCREKLGIKEMAGLKAHKICTCRKCGKTIDVRFIIY